MGGIIETLRAGSWLNRERARLWGLAVLIASLAGALYIAATSRGLTDYQGRPLGTDFANVYAAGTYVLDGRPELAFDPPAQHAREQAIFGAATPFYGWHYPPFFLFVAGLLATMPYLLALAVWQGVSFGLYLGTIGAILSACLPAKNGAAGLGFLLALAYPAVFINIGHGHNGFLTAALMGGALVLLDRRPIVAGILFGLLAYKPQFGLMIPLVLVATGRWRTFAAAAATVGVLALLTTLAFGVKVWPAFLASTEFTRIVVLEAGDTGWHKIQSVFSWVRMWGGSVELAYAIQAGVTIAVAAALLWLWRSPVAAPLKAAALILGALIATPYSLDYDMMVLAPAIAFFAAEGIAHGFRPWEKTALAVLWLVPLVARSFAEVTMIPIGAPAMILVFMLIMRRRTAAQNCHLAAAV